MDASAFKIFPAAVVNDGGTNGGPHAFAPIASGAFANIFRAVTTDEATAGVELYRKVFLAPHDPAGELTTEMRVAFEAIQGDLQISPDASHTDTRADIDPSTMSWYGGGTLNASVLAGVTQLVVAVADGEDTGIWDGDELVITDISGAREIAKVNGMPVAAGDLVTINLVAPTASSHAAGAAVSSRFISSASLAKVNSSTVNTTITLTFDAAAVTFHPQGAVFDTVTLTFTSATAFTATGVRVASYGSGTKGSTFAPNNPTWGKPYFTLPAAALGGTAVAGDTVVFEVYPALVPAWLRWRVPAGSPAGQQRSFIGMTAYGAAP